MDEDADLQRFVAVEVVEESPAARIGTCFGVWAVSVVYGGDDDDGASGVGVGHQG
jgi:hypothetical protein